jgi:hypothetical protein
MQEEDWKEASLSPAEMTRTTPPAGGGVHVKVEKLFSSNYLFSVVLVKENMNIEMSLKLSLPMFYSFFIVWNVANIWFTVYGKDQIPNRFDS